MRKKALLLVALCATSFSASQAKSFWLKLSSRNLQAEKALQEIPTWLSLPQENSFELVKDYTDHIGFRHQVYRQYVAGVQVDGGIVKVHSHNGTITSANGYVVERAQAPRQLRSIAGNKGMAYDGRKLMIVDTGDGARYAYKSYDNATNEEVFTDAETGETIKRLPRRFYADILTKGETIYSGTREFSINKAADGRYILNDSTRHIYTLDARSASADTTPYKDDKYEEGYDAKQYAFDNTHPLYNSDMEWSLLRVDSIAVDSIGKMPTDGESNFRLAVTHTNIYNEDEIHAMLIANITSTPAIMDMTDFYTEAGFPASINMDWTEEGDGNTVARNATISNTIAEPGVYDWYAEDKDGKRIAKGRYFVSRTAHFATDIQWGMEQTYDFFKEVFHRNSYDGEGAPIYNVVYPILPVNGMPEDPVFVYPPNNSAAQASDTFSFLIYGLGGYKYNITVPIDVIAHEFTHLLTWKTAGLEYTGESGALNESFSDIIGVTIRQKVKNLKDSPDKWLQGSEMIKNAEQIAARNLKDPESVKKPATYKGLYWCDTNDDYDWGGVHFNSSVQSLWYYFISEGGEYTDGNGATHSFIGLGTDKAIQIAYRNLSEMLTSKAQYADAVIGSVQAAEDLFGEDSMEKQVAIDAWAAVGLNSDGTATGITQTALPANRTCDNAIYRLDGTRISSAKSLAPGIYIKNGKKIVICPNK